MTHKHDTGSDDLNDALDRLVSHLQAKGYVSLNPPLYDVLHAAGRCPFTLEVSGESLRGRDADAIGVSRDMTAAERFPDPVLSVRQPWAWAIIHGGKNVENRTWGTRYRGRLWIHASSREIADDIDIATALTGKQWKAPQAQAIAHYCENNCRGAIVGSVTLVDVRRYGEQVGLWAMGPFGWLLRNPLPCDPWPMPGRLGLWRVS